MKKYLANSAFKDIREVEIVRETDSSVYFLCGAAWATGGARREAKISEGRRYFDTWEEARRFLLEIEEGKIAALTRELARRQENVRKIEEMTE